MIESKKSWRNQQNSRKGVSSRNDSFRNRKGHGYQVQHQPNSNSTTKRNISVTANSNSIVSTSPWDVSSDNNTNANLAAVKIQSTMKWDVTQEQRPAYTGTDKLSSSKSESRKPSAYKRAVDAFKTKRQTAEEEKRLREKQVVEKNRKREENIAKRKANFKVYSRKNKFGQPVMAGRIQQMLEKIQNST